MSSPPGRWDPLRGRWKLGQVIRDYLRVAPDPVAVEDLIKHLRVEGYSMDAVLRVLLQYVDVDAVGHVTRKTGGG